MNSTAKQIAKVCFSQIKGSLNLIQTNLRINPYHKDYSQLQGVLRQLQLQEKQAANLILNQKLPPPLFTCDLLAGLAVSVGQVLSEDFGNDCLVVRLVKGQEWANDRIRQLNELGVGQKQLRELLINYRDVLQSYTIQKEMRSRGGRLLKNLV